MSLQARVIDLLVAKSALNEASVLDVTQVGRATSKTIYVVFGAGTSAGAVSIEAAHDPNYTGTWANIATVAWAAATRVHEVVVSAGHIALRARISTGIVGGNVDVKALVNQ